ncbi:uncharacterized protein C5orf34 homolog isoform 2-T2 [Odontesthes bonariensis]|uniref:uncharacterized protein C5orf34 homolog isoform X2 n=1 Tax=Odontesthes bonariensis TaxID=219752 RepID=UPI003F5900E2
MERKPDGKGRSSSSMGNGSQLQLSPCGCEFMLVKATDPHGHPLQPTERVRQRSRFTISTYKELMLAALAFRNKYASRPYLPEELLPSDHKKLFFSIESGVQWPELSSYEAELGPGGEVIVRSEDERAMLALSPSGEDFCVEFTCSLSRPQNQHRGTQCLSRHPDGSPGSQLQVSKMRGSRKKDPNSSRSPQIMGAAQDKPELMYQSTTVTQHHSCCDVASIWAYPLSLARHHWMSHRPQHKDVEAEAASSSIQADEKTIISDVSCVERRSQLPQALPLTCPSPHWHRWKFKDPLAGEDVSDLPTDLVKMIWCQGVNYRILREAVPVIEISPGDGSVIRSNGVLNSYFTHYKPQLQSEQVKELNYHFHSLPPDVLGQVYSVRSVVSRASRILACYNQARQLLKLPATPTCLLEEKHISEPETFEESPSGSVLVEQNVNATQTADCRSDLVASELSKIKRFNFLLENSHLLQSESKHVDLETSSAEGAHEPVYEDHIARALQRTSRAIQDIDAVISAATLT